MHKNVKMMKVKVGSLDMLKGNYVLLWSWRS
jgi:hypothetical protein